MKSNQTVTLKYVGIKIDCVSLLVGEVPKKGKTYIISSETFKKSSPDPDQWQLAKEPKKIAAKKTSGSKKA